MVQEAENNEHEDGEMELGGGDAEKLEPGHHVFIGETYNSGPYLTEEDAQAFINGHLGGEGSVRHVA